MSLGASLTIDGDIDEEVIEDEFEQSNSKPKIQPQAQVANQISGGGLMGCIDEKTTINKISQGSTEGSTGDSYDSQDKGAGKIHRRSFDKVDSSKDQVINLD